MNPTFIGTMTGPLTGIEVNSTMPVRKPKTRRKGATKNQGRKRNISQTDQPFEQDAKRRIGQFGGAGEPPIKK